MPHALLVALVGLPVGFLMGLTSFTGAIIVPTLVLCFGLAQAKAQGTAVALTLSPLQVGTIWNFHRAGNVDWRTMGLMVPGVIVGTFLGSRLANQLPPATLKMIFGLTMVYFGAYFVMMTTTTNIARGLGLAAVVTAFAGIVMATSRWMETTATIAA